MIDSLTTLQTDYKASILYSVISGSQAYGTSTPESDTDIKGIFALPAAAYLSINSPPKQVSDEKNDVVYYSLQRIMQLLSEANPNILELLFTPDSCVQFKHDALQPVFESKHAFVTLKGVDAHLGYAHTQIKKAKGQNKWVNNPQPEAKPAIEEYCWLLGMGMDAQSSLPMRPISLLSSTLNLNDYHCSSVEHVPNLYRLYHYPESSNGIFNNGHIHCQSIPLEDEAARYAGLLYINVTAWDQARRDHTHYWIWRKNRNDSRWQQQERGELDYDAKNMMHTIRLLLSAEHMLIAGEPIVRFEGEAQSQLMDIRRGQYDYDELLTLSSSLLARCQSLMEKTKLQKRVSAKLVENLLQEVTATWQSQQ